MLMLIVWKLAAASYCVKYTQIGMIARPIPIVAAPMIPHTVRRRV